eukprot:jgi/Orpsp1_1/1181293/evm.model.c7180000076639.1
MTKIAVVGATGFYGGIAIDYLIERGVKPSDIVALYRNESKVAPLKEKGIEVRKGDYQSGQYPPSIFDGVEKLLFIPGNDIDSFKRIKDHLVVIEAASKAKISHIVYPGISFPEKSTFGMENVHVATESAIKAAGIPYTFLRNTFYTEYMLPEKDLKHAVESGVLETLPHGKKINFVPREDMAHAAAVVLTSEGHINKTYDITAPIAYTYQDVADALTKVTGKTVKVQETTSEKRAAFLDSIGVPKQFQVFDLVLIQASFGSGWTEGVSSALADLIGPDNVTTPEKLVKKIFA